MNRIALIGRLTRDPDIRYTQSGNAVCSFTLAVDRPYSGQQGDKETDFISIVVWRKAAEACANNLGKGRLVAVEGRLQIRSYETPEGQKRWVTEVVAERVQFLDKAKTESSQGQTAYSDQELEDLPF
jgi:single-strand DNA-binding protein